VNSRTIIALALMAGVFVMEGYDIFAMPLALPRLDEGLPALPDNAGLFFSIVGAPFGLFGLWPPSFGLVMTGVLLGIGIGGALVAPFGDRFGRRTLIVLGCLATGLFTFITTTSGSIAEFFLWRMMTGIALGAALPNVSALSAELAPPNLRGTVMAVVSAGIPVGIGLAGVLAPEVVGMWGWQGLFYVPGGAAIILALALFAVLEGGAPQSAGSPAAAAKPVRFPQAALFKQPWVIPFAVVAAMLALNAMNLYLLNSWLPTILPMAGFEQEMADRISGIVQFAGIGIGVAASFGIDRWKPATTLVLMFGAMALCFFGVSVSAPDALRWTLLLCVGVGGASAGGMALPALCAHMFPPQQLSTAIGMGILVARLGAFAGPLVGEAIVEAEMGAQPFFLAAATAPALCVLVALLVPMALKVRVREEAPVTA